MLQVITRALFYDLFFKFTFGAILDKTGLSSVTKVNFTGELGEAQEGDKPSSLSN
jgi:hypothetical protein